MKTLVTGANGFAGLHLLRELLRRGERGVVAASLDGTPVPGFAEGEVEWASLDITSTDSVRSVVRAHRPDRIFHLAGQSSVSQSFENPLVTWEVNATGTVRLLDALVREGRPTRALVISSAEVYGAVSRDDLPISESHPMRPITPYGSSKAATEVVALQTATGGLVDVVLARSFNHIGPGQDARFALPSMAQQLVRIRRGQAEPVLHVGNLNVCRDFLDVRDVARAYATLMETGESSAVYNVCSGEARSLLDVVEALVRLSDTGARLEVDPDRVRAVDIPLLVGDPGRLRALGWAPQISMEDSLRDLLAAAEEA